MLMIIGLIFCTSDIHNLYVGFLLTCLLKEHLYIAMYISYVLLYILCVKSM